MNDSNTVWHKNFITMHSLTYKLGYHEAIVLLTVGYIKQPYCCFFIINARSVIPVNKYKLLFHIVFIFCKDLFIYLRERAQAHTGEWGGAKG